MTSHSVSGSSTAAIVSTCGAPNDCVYPITTSVCYTLLGFIRLRHTNALLGQLSCAGTGSLDAMSNVSGSQ
jgi:hypothetical protein